jgi:electron transfer flavoprotein alpha subunit
MSVLIIAEHQNNQLKVETHKSITAGLALGDTVDVLVLGEHVNEVASEVSNIVGIHQVLVADHAAYAHQLPENSAALIHTLSQGYTHILAPATTTGKNIMPRVAALLDVCQISDISEVLAADTFKRPIYAGNVIATVQSSDPIKVITVRCASFDRAETGNNAPVVAVEQVIDNALSQFVSEEQAVSERPDLSAASVVISGGRGMQNGENFALLEGIADKLGAAIGASRAAVDAGFVPNDMQVGQTGKIVAPDLYIAVGISGAIQHLAGMKDSKIIVAINKDEDAPIFQVADYGLVADLFTVLPELEQAL